MAPMWGDGIERVQKGAVGDVGRGVRTHKPGHESVVGSLEGYEVEPGPAFGDEQTNARSLVDGLRLGLGERTGGARELAS